MGIQIQSTVIYRQIMQVIHICPYNAQSHIFITWNNHHVLGMMIGYFIEIIWIVQIGF